MLIPFMMPIVMLFTLSTPFAETRVGKARAKRLDGDSRSRWNCRHIYSLLADTAAIAADITQLHTTSLLADAAAVAVFTLCSLLSWLTQGTQP